MSDAAHTELKFGLFDLAVAHPEGFTYEDAQRHFGWPPGTGPAIPANGWHSFVVRCVLSVVNASVEPLTSVDVYNQIAPSRRYQSPGQDSVRVALKALAKAERIRRVPRHIGGELRVTWQPMTMPDPGPQAAMRPPPLVEPGPVRACLEQNGPQTSKDIAGRLGISRQIVQRTLRQLLETGEGRTNDGLWTVALPSPDDPIQKPEV